MDKFKQALKNKRPLLGTFIKTPHFHNVEVLSHVNFDTLCIDAEHSPFDRHSIDTSILAAKSNNQHILVRLPDDHPGTILNTLDLGANGIVVPHVKSAAQLEKIIQNCYFGENGRGYAGSTRMAGYTSRSLEENIKYNRCHTVVVAQIEDLSALSELDEICQIEKVDCLFIGRMDLTVALGESNPNAPRVLDTVNKIIETAGKYDMPTGMFVANLDELPMWIKKQVSLFLLGSDHSFMLNSAAQLKQRFKDAQSHQDFFIKGGLDEK